MSEDGEHGEPAAVPVELPPVAEFVAPANDGAGDAAPAWNDYGDQGRTRRGRDVALLIATLAVLAFAAFVLRSGGHSGAGNAQISAGTIPTAPASLPAPDTSAPTAADSPSPTDGATDSPSPTDSPSASPTDSPSLIPTAIPSGPTSASPGTAALVAGQQSAITAALAQTSYPGTLTPPIAQLAAAGSPEWIADGCLSVTSANETACGYGRATAIRHAVLIGDEDAISYLPMLRQALPIDWNIQVLTSAGCPIGDITVLEPGSQGGDCANHQEFVLHQIQSIKPDIVFAADSDAELAREPASTDTQRIRTLEEAFRGEIKQLLPYTSHVITIGSPPGSGNLQKCSGPAACTLTPDDSWKLWTQSERDESATLATIYVDTTQWFCAGGRCPAVIGSTPVYTDGTHLTDAFSESLEPLIAASLGKLI